MAEGSAMDEPKRGDWLTAHGFKLLALAATLAYVGGGVAYVSVGRGSTLFVCDGFQYYCYLPSLALDRDLDFTDEYALGRPDYRESPFTAVVPATGRPANAWTVGPAVLWAPFFLFGLLLEAIAGDVTGFSMWCQWPVYLGSLVYGLAGVWLLLRKVLVDYDPLTRLLAVAVMLVGTNLNYYFFFAGHMSHVLSFFALALHLFCLRELRRQPDRLRWWAFSGLSLSLAGLVRWQDVVIGLLALTVAGEIVWRRRAKALPGVLCGVAGILPAIAIQAIVWNAIYGEPFLVPQGDEWMTWTQPHLAEVLFSYPQGLLLNSPIVILGIGGSVLLASRDRVWGLGSLLAVAAAVYACAACRQWFGGESFGIRRLVSVLPVLSIGLCESVRWARSRPYSRWVWAGGIAGVAWNWVLLVVYFFERVENP
jgi:hypothetical protein